MCLKRESPGELFPGDFFVPERNYFGKISTSYFYTDEEFDHRGERLDIMEERTAFENAVFRDINANVYLEYGLTDRLTLVATLPFEWLRSERDVVVMGGLVRQKEVLHTFGPGDVTLSGRRQLFGAPLAASIQAGVKLPLGYAERPSNDGPPLGTARVDGEAHFMVGKSLHPLPSYLTASLGYRRRGGRLHDEVVYTAEVGYEIGPALIKVALDGIQNTSRPPDIAGGTVVTPLPGGGGVLPDLLVGDQHIAKLSPAIVYALKPGLALQAEFLHTIAGTNTLSGTIYSLGIIFQGKR